MIFPLMWASPSAPPLRLLQLRDPPPPAAAATVLVLPGRSGAEIALTGKFWQILRCRLRTLYAAAPHHPFSWAADSAHYGIKRPTWTCRNVWNLPWRADGPIPDLEKLQTLRALGVDRMSINPPVPAGPGAEALRPAPSRRRIFSGPMTRPFRRALRTSTWT